MKNNFSALLKISTLNAIFIFECSMNVFPSDVNHGHGYSSPGTILGL